MYQRMLLTLDRSPLAEKALPHAVALAQACHAALELVSVVPLSDVQASAEYVVYVDRDQEAAQCEEYLRSVQSRLQGEGLQVGATVRRGDVTEEILNHADECGADLIVMSTHGRSGLGRWVYGSIADRVLRHASVPVLLVRASE
ncbi:universal stress protein [bacterium]|nr:universal stress protein [bacterium]